MSQLVFYVIKLGPENYFRDWVPIGPRFGAKLEEAKRFESKSMAEFVMGDWRFTMCEIQEVYTP